MINFQNVWKIFKKEILLYARDKSVIFTNLFVPFIVGPLYLIFIMEVATQMAKKDAPVKDDVVFNVSIQGKVAKQLREALQSDPKIKLSTNTMTISQNDIVDYRNKFRAFHGQFQKEQKLTFKIGQSVAQSGPSQLVQLKLEVTEAKARIEKGFDFKAVDLHVALFPTPEGGMASYMFYSSELPKSRAAYSYVKKQIELQRQQLFNSRIQSRPAIADLLPPEYSFWEVDLIEPGSKFYLIGGLMATVGILMILLTGIYMPTIKSTIGEKDAKTYKVLMMSPIGPSEIFLGKLLSITVQGIVLLIPYTIEYFIIYALGEKSGAIDLMAHFTFWSYLQVAAMVLTVVMIVASLCFFACSFAKSSNQAQSLLSLLMLGVTMPLIIIGLNEPQLNYANAFLPLYNFPLVLSALLEKKLGGGPFAIALLTNLLTAVGITLLSVNAFTVQWKGRDDSLSFSEILSRKTKRGGELTSSHAFFAFAVILVGFFVSKAFSALQFDFLYYFAFPLVFLLGSGLSVIAYTKIDPFKTLKWNGGLGVTKRLAWAGLSFGIGFAAIVAALPESWWNHQYYQLFSSSSMSGLAASLLLFAILPVICEEILFRGLIFQGLRAQYSFMTSTMLSTLMSSLIMVSAYKNPWIVVLSLGLNWVFERRNLSASMLTHILVKGTTILFLLKWGESFHASPALSFGIGLGFIGLGAWLMAMEPKPLPVCPVLLLPSEESKAA